MVPADRCKNKKEQNRSSRHEIFVIYTLLLNLYIILSLSFQNMTTIHNDNHVLLAKSSPNFSSPPLNSLYLIFLLFNDVIYHLQRLAFLYWHSFSANFACNYRITTPRTIKEICLEEKNLNLSLNYYYLRVDRSSLSIYTFFK